MSVCCFKSTAIGHRHRMLTFREAQARPPRMGVRGPVFYGRSHPPVFFQTQHLLSCFSVISSLTFSQGSRTAPPPPVLGDTGVETPRLKIAPHYSWLCFCSLPRGSRLRKPLPSASLQSTLASVCWPAELPAAWGWHRGSLWEDFPYVPVLAAAEVLGLEGWGWAAACFCLFVLGSFLLSSSRPCFLSQGTSSYHDSVTAKKLVSIQNHGPARGLS